MIIYTIKHNDSGMVYIGQTVQTLNRRIRAHMRLRGCVRIHNALCKHGIDAFTVEEVDSADTKAGLNLLEEAWIAAMDCISPKGYNLKTGGGARGIPCAETRKKMSDRLKGRKFSEIHRKNLSESLRGRKITEATRERLRESHLGYHPSEDVLEKMRKSQQERVGPRYEITDEIRNKMSEARKGALLSQEHRENIGAALRGHTHTPAAIENMRKAQNREATKKKKSEYMKGKPISYYEDLHNSNKGRKRGTETIERMKQAWITRRKNNIGEK